MRRTGLIISALGAAVAILLLAALDPIGLAAWGTPFYAPLTNGSVLAAALIAAVAGAVLFLWEKPPR